MHGNFDMHFLGRRKHAMTQFLKFGLVGVLNTVIAYVVYLFFVMVGIHYMISNLIGFSVSVVNSYYWNNRYVFKAEGQRVWWKTLAKTYISYAGTGIVLSSLLLFLWVDVCGIMEEVAPLLNLLFTVPINFIVNKFWAYKG